MFFHPPHGLVNFLIALLAVLARPYILKRLDVLGLLLQLHIIPESRAVERAFFQRLFYGAARLVLVAAVPEIAVARDCLYVGERVVERFIDIL